MVPLIRRHQGRGEASTAVDHTLGAMAFVIPIGVLLWMQFSSHGSPVSTVLLCLLAGKLITAQWSRLLTKRSRMSAIPSSTPTRNLRVSLVMPLHNEDPTFAVAAIKSMLGQTQLPHHIHVVDDGSTDGSAAIEAVQAALDELAEPGTWTVSRFARNLGKRHALAHGFRADPAADVFLCVDSDTVLDPHAIEEGIRPFADPRVASVAGVVSAQNWSRNILTRLIDLRYISAFLSERAAYSVFGAVLCCCGSLAFYRADVVRDNLDDFLDQRFLGSVATFGDDRRLTNYALRAGKVVLCESSRASTGVPERLGHYVRQQLRWNKSFVRESMWVLGTFPLKASAFWLTLCEVLAWVLVSTLFIVSLAIWPFTDSSPSLWGFAGLVALAAYARNAAYLQDTHADMRRRDRIAVFLLAPLYGILHIVVLTPIRVWALLTLADTAWGTRSEVEVRFLAR